MKSNSARYSTCWWPAILVLLINSELAMSAVHVEINVHDSSETCARECILYNQKYNNEYLYGGQTISSVLRRNVYTWSPQLVNMYRDKEAYTFNDDDFKGVWYFEPVNCETNVFYLKNKEYNEYLYATEFHYSFMNDRRRVYTHQPEKTSDLDDAYKWRVERVRGDGDNQDLYVLKNIKYNEPLYAAGFFFRRDSLRRSVFTWHGGPHNDQFNWIVKCRDGYSLLEGKK